jgi:competence protein ComEA
MRMPEISRGRAAAYLVAMLAMLALAGRIVFAGDGRNVAGPPAGADVGAALTSSLDAEPAPPRTIVVHVVGAVRKPGLYELPEGSRVDDALELAGGARERAAVELVNLAAPVADGQQIVVPVRAEGAGAAAVPRSDLTGAGGAGASPAAGPPAPVHLNTATLEELDALPGVGPVTAQKILDYRASHGSFRSVDELDAIPGIGPARLEQLRELVQP